MKVVRIALVIAILALTARQGHAQVIKGSITGNVTQAGAGVTGIVVGDLVSGTYSYDSAVVANDIFGRPSNPLTAFSLTIGTNPHVFTLADLQPGLFNQERILQFTTPTVDSLEFFFDPTVLSNALGVAIGSQSIGNSIPQSYTASNVTGGIAVRFGFAAVHSSAVPEPSSLALLTGLLVPGAAFLTRRRKTSR